MRRIGRGSIVAGVLCAHAAIGSGWWSREATAHNPITTTVTWSREISALVQRRCISCHRGDGYGGFSLATYRDARPWAVAIKEEVLTGHMPPWGAAAGIGHFANDRRLTRHEQELVAAWVDGGAPFAPGARTPAFASGAVAADAPIVPAASPADGTAIPLAPASIPSATERTASLSLQLPEPATLTAWSFEPGLASSIERVDLDVGRRWVGTWTPGESTISFPAGTGARLQEAVHFTLTIQYSAPASPATDRSRLLVWIAREQRPNEIGAITVIRSWRVPQAVQVLALRPARSVDESHVAARFPGGRIELLAELAQPSRGVHPTYRLARPLALPAGARVETTRPIRVLYAAGGTRTVNRNVSRRPRR